MALRLRSPWVRAASVCLAVLLVGTAYVFVFFGRRTALPGTPYELLVQPGVSDASLALVRTGLSEADTFLLEHMGQTVSAPAEVRVSDFTPCSPFQPIPQLGSTAEVVGNRLCVNTHSGVWQQALGGEPGIAYSVMAHEHFHLFQNQLGCLPSPWHKDYQWLIEGSAAYIGWETAIASGKLSRAWVDTQLAAARQPVVLPPLSTLERSIDGDAAYSLAYSAVRQLFTRADSMQSFTTFCQEVGHGTPWRDAFAQAFGISVDEFYRTFTATSDVPPRDRPFPQAIAPCPTRTALL